MSTAKRNKKRKATDETVAASPKSKVSLDVGGTMFVAAKSTLMSNSTYFESLLSTRWAALEREDEATSDHTDDSIFLDQNPGPFAILLDSMREGRAYLPRNDPDLCEKVLLQAEFLGMTGFTSEVKATAYRHIASTMMNEITVPDDAEVAAAFDHEYGSIREAIKNCILPKCFFPPTPNLDVMASGVKVFTVPKEHLMRAPYFERMLSSDPTDYWKTSCALCVRPELLEIAMDGITVDRGMVGEYSANLLKKVMSSMDKDTLSTDVVKMMTRSYVKDLRHVLLMLGLSTEDLDREFS